MADCVTYCAVDLSHCNRDLETRQLKLSAEHFPFPCTLRELVLDRYADTTAEKGSDSHTMRLEELLGYLKNTEEFALGPWAAIVNQTEAIGDPAQPSPDQKAVLQWLGKAVDFWEQDYPLEEPLVAQLRQIKPLCAALAMVDPSFLFPGAHPAHQLLDAIQDRAVGWQSTLDRVGTILVQQISNAVQGSRGWFDDKDTDLNKVFGDFAKAVERDQSRANRMVQRVIDAELGKFKTQAAKYDAANMINGALEQYAVPQDIEEFLKGPWYTSAQLLLLKFGVDSDQWRKMSETTVTLLDSLQSLEDADEGRRQHIFEVVTKLPKEMRRWLLSVHHDTEAVNEAMGQVEYTHLRILRRQPVDLVHLDPISITKSEQQSAHNELVDLGDCEEGSWFAIGQGEEQLRVQLALKAEASSEFLFTNLAGIKVLQLNARDFADKLALGKATPLNFGHSFSKSLAKAAGIESAELLHALAEALGAVQAGTLQQNGVDEAIHAEIQEVSEGATTPREQTEQEASTPRDAAALERRSEATLETATSSPGQQDAAAQQTPTSAPQEAQVEEMGVLSRGFQPVSAMGEGFLAQQAQELEYGKDTALQDEPPEALELERPVNTAQQLTADAERTLNLPMGIWLGFHDVETPIMGRLAVHDAVEDQFIFVNRKGFKLRSLTHAQLLELIDGGLVDILQRSSNLRDQVIEVRNSLDHSRQDS